MSTPFRFHVPADAFEKALPDGRKSKRIGGIVTTPNRDQQDETVGLAGLDFSEFEKSGYFNDNHGKSTTDLVAFPDMGVRRVKAGAELPNGQKAKADGVWAEGILVGHKGDEVYQIAKDLQGTGRSLGFSIEGKILERDPLDPRHVAKAKVVNIAVTHCPVNAETELVLLSKAMFAGSAIANPGAAPGQGFALRTESLAPELKILTFKGPAGTELQPKKKKAKKKKRLLVEKDGVAALKAQYPHLPDAQARDAYRFACGCKAAGLLG